MYGIGQCPDALVAENVPMPLKETWSAQCEAARSIAEEFGEEKALGYLIGEKFLNFLQMAEHDPELRAEIPAFAAEIKSIFDQRQIEQFLTTPRRLGAMGHVLDEEAHAAFRDIDDPAHVLREDAGNLTALEWAKESLLVEGDRSDRQTRGE